MDNKILRSSLTAGIVAAIVLSTGIGDVLGAFIRTNMTGTPDGTCGYGYGYDSVAGYGNGYGSACVTPSIGGGGSAYKPVPLETLGSTTSTSSSSTTTTNPSTSTDNTNPYGSNYVNWDDGLEGSSSKADEGVWDDTTITSSTNSTAGNTGGTTVITSNTGVATGKRRLPATGA